MSREFDEILAFLERFQLGPELEREPEMPPELRERLERFSDGLCSDEERMEVCELLKSDPALVRWVAERVKNRRDL